MNNQTPTENKEKTVFDHIDLITSIIHLLTSIFLALLIFFGTPNPFAEPITFFVWGACSTTRYFLPLPESKDTKNTILFVLGICLILAGIYEFPY